jgi:hypothetical protein
MRTITFINARTPLSIVPDEFLRTGARVLVVLADDRTPIGALTPKRLFEIENRMSRDEFRRRTVGEAVASTMPFDPATMTPEPIDDGLLAHAHASQP